MTLTRSSVTAASRVMLPAYPVFAAGIGLSFTLTPHERLTATPALAYADALLPLPLWGGGFLLLAGLLVGALLGHSRRLYQSGLAVMVVWMTLYAAVMLLAAIYGQASWSGWTWPSFVGAACWASMLSLEAREV